MVCGLREKMPVSKRAKNFLLQTEQLNKLKALEIPENLKVPSPQTSPFSSNVEVHMKYNEKTVYKKLIDGEWFIATPEAAKMKGNRVAECWKNSVRLIVEKKEDNFEFTGWLIHHATDDNGTYCGWLSKQKGPKIRTSDLGNHFTKGAKCKAGVPDAEPSPRLNFAPRPVKKTIEPSKAQWEKMIGGVCKLRTSL